MEPGCPPGSVRSITLLKHADVGLVAVAQSFGKLVISWKNKKNLEMYFAFGKTIKHLRFKSG